MIKPILQLPVYEPAGRDVQLEETDLLQHLLILGATGCGKTTLLRRILSQLLPRPDTGLLIFDAKQDDTIEWVSHLAARHERQMIVLGTRGTHYLDLFGSFHCLSDVEAMVSRLLSGCAQMGSDNAFWNEMRSAMLDAALSMLVVEGTPVTYQSALKLMSGWFFRQSAPERVTRLIAAIEGQLTDCSPMVNRKLQQTLDTVNMWRTMDYRTRSNVAATLVNALRPFSSAGASRCFEPTDRPAYDVSDLVRQGGVCVASVNATTEPELAALFFKLVKRDFLNAVQQRRDGRGVLCGIIADELPLLASADDVETLTTVRSRRCFVCAGSQGMAILEEKLGPRQRRALVANFGTLIYMRGREEETDLSAVVHLGVADYWKTRSKLRDVGGTLAHESERIRRQRLICPPGTLGRLQPHQGFVALPNHEQCELPFWFIPYYEDEAAPPIPAPPIFVPTKLVDPASAERLYDLLRDRGHSRHLDESQLQAALKLFSDRKGRKRALAKAKMIFRSRAILVPDGMDKLPLPWLKALPGIVWSLRQPHWTHLPFMIREVFVTNGLLQLRFAQEPMRDPADQHVSGFDLVRLAVNTRLYPSCYRPLHRRHAGLVNVTQPDLPLL